MSLTGFISYKRVGWTGQTPWNPTNLNIMDKGIKDNNDMIANLRGEVSALNNNINKCLKVLNLSGKDGQSAKEIIQKYIDKNAFNTGIYVGNINRGSQDGYICSATGNTYMAFIVFGYAYASLQYYIYMSGKWIH